MYVSADIDLVDCSSTDAGKAMKMTGNAALAVIKYNYRREGALKMNLGRAYRVRWRLGGWSGQMVHGLRPAINHSCRLFDFLEAAVIAVGHNVRGIASFKGRQIELWLRGSALLMALAECVAVDAGAVRFLGNIWLRLI